MAYAAGVILLVMAVVIGIAMALQINAFTRGRSIISPRQLGLRIVCGVLLLIIIGMIYYGLAREWTNPLHELIFWAALTLLPLMVIVVAYIDLKETQVIGELRQARLYTGALRAEQEILKGQEQPEEDN